MRHFCTQFDRNYLSRGLVLHQSLTRHCPDFTLWVLCLDAESHARMQKLALPNVRLTALSELEQADPALLAVKPTRSVVEYYFTCAPVFPWHLLQREPAIDLLTMLDCDLYLFADPTPAFEEMGSHSVAITPHRFTPELMHLQQNGLYNVGWLSFRRDKAGLDCLGWWRERCLEWCFDRCEPDRYADQKYLDEFPKRFPGVIVLQHPGVNLAPWNVANYRITRGPQGPLVDGQPVICYHFQRFRQLTSWLYDTNLVNYKVRPTRGMMHELYEPYLRALRATEADIPTGVRYRGFRQHVRHAYKTLRSIFSGGTLLWLNNRVC